MASSIPRSSASTPGAFADLTADGKELEFGRPRPCLLESRSTANCGRRGDCRIPIAEQQRSGGRLAAHALLVFSGTDVAFAAGFPNAWASSTLGANDGDALQIAQQQEPAGRLRSLPLPPDRLQRVCKRGMPGFGEMRDGSRGRGGDLVLTGACPETPPSTFPDLAALHGDNWRLEADGPSRR